MSTLKCGLRLKSGFLFLGLASLFFFQPLFAAEPPASCVGQFLGELAKEAIPMKVGNLPEPTAIPRNRLEAHEYVEQLNAAPMASFFSEQALEQPVIQNWHILNGSLDPFEAELQRFLRYFEASSRWVRAQGVNPDKRAFLQWFEMRQRQLLTREQVAYLRAQNYTFQRFRSELLALYVKERGSRPLGRSERVFSYVTSNPYAWSAFSRTYGWTVQSVAFLGGILYFATVSGPVSKILSAYLAAVTDPIETGSKKLGAKQLLLPSVWVQEFVDRASRVSEGEMKVYRDKLVELQEDLRAAKKLGPEEWENSIKDRYSRLYYDVLLSVYAYLPSNIRDGRSWYFEFYVRQPLGFAVAASQFRQEALQLTSRYENILPRKAELVERGRILARNPLSTQAGTQESLEFQMITDQLAFLKSYPEELKAKKRQVATAMVMWQMTDLQYREVLTGRDHKGHVIPTDYDVFRKWLGYEETTQLFSDEINELIELIDNYVLKSTPQ